MGVTKLPVSIKLVTEIKENGQSEQIVVETIGHFMHQGDRAVIVFTEKQQDGSPIDSMIAVQPDKVSVKRTGAVNMHQQFQKKQSTENVYRHAYGTIHMETFTDQITYRQLQKDKTGKLFISYTTKLNGESERRHRLTLSFKEAIQ